MKLVKVIKNNEVVQPVRFDNDESMNAWIQMLAETCAWGKPERWVLDAPSSPLTEEEKASALESRSVEVMGEMLTEYRLPSEYEISIEDVSAQVEQEAVNKEALEYLASTDWMCQRHRDQMDAGMTTSLGMEEYQVLLAERQAARARVVR